MFPQVLAAIRKGQYRKPNTGSYEWLRRNGTVVSNFTYVGDAAGRRKDWAPGQEVIYTVKRNGYDKEISLTLAPMPADVMAQWIGKHMIEHAASGDLAEAMP